MLLKGLKNLAGIVLLQGVSFLVGIWAASFLGKGEFGGLQFLRTILGYSAFTTLGVSQAVMFELPVALGRGDTGEVESIQRFYNTLLMASGAFALAVSAVMALLKVPLNGVALSWEWGWLGVVLALSGWSGYSQLLFQSYQQFGKLGTFRLLYPVFFAVTVWVLLPKYRIGGFLFAMATGYAALVAYGLHAHRSSLGFLWDTGRFWHYVRIGLPIRLNSFVWMLVTSIDLWLVSFCIGTDAAGVYGFAMMVSTAYGLIPGIVAEMGMPRISTLFGRCYLDPKPLAGPARHSLLAFAGLNVLPAILSLLAFDIIIAYWVPKYRESGPIMLLLVIGYYVNSVSALAGNILILLRQQRVMLVASLFVLLVVAASGFGSAKVFGTAPAVAAATALGLCLNGLVTLGFIVRQVEIERLPAFLARLLAQVICGVAAIVTSWAVAQGFSGWQRIGMFAASGLFCSGFHTFIGIREIARFWSITRVDSPLDPVVPMMAKEVAAQ